jgi:hypothetical protein
MNRELDAVAERALAQKALDDEALFDTLVARGAVESSLEDPAFRAMLAAPERRKYWPIAMTGAALAAAAALLTFFVLRPSHLIQHPVEISKAVLSGDLKPLAHQAPVFRGADTASRSPRSDGTILSIEDGVATVNLGSIDGLAKGTELEASHDKQAGRIAITTVFRDRARGTVDSAAIQANDPVRVPTSVHFGAILEEVNALAARGDLTAARDIARNTLGAGSPGETRGLLEKLAALDYQAGATDVARQHYQLAVDNLDQAPAASPAERAATLANYGTVSMLSGDPARARELLQKALPLAADPTLRSQIVNNLALVNRP